MPAFWSVEVLNVLLLGERKGRITWPNIRKSIVINGRPSTILGQRDNRDHGNAAAAAAILSRATTFNATCTWPLSRIVTGVASPTQNDRKPRTSVIPG